MKKNVPYSQCGPTKPLSHEHQYPVVVKLSELQLPWIQGLELQ